MKRRIIWLVILPWSSGLYLLLDENSYQGWDALEAADFRMGATRRQVRDQPCIWRRFFTPMLTFLKALPAAGFLLNITGENTWDFENFMTICWCVGKSWFIYVVCLPEIIEWIVDLYYRVGFIIILFLWNSFWKLQILVLIEAVNLFV